jgi:hypothetical protein
MHAGLHNYHHIIVKSALNQYAQQDATTANTIWVCSFKLLVLFVSLCL